MAIKEHIIGLSVDDARTLLEQNNMALRIMKRDGEHLIGTCDWRLNRLNVEVEQGVVTSVMAIG